LEILTTGLVWRPNEHHRTKLREDRSNHSGDMADFSRWRSSAIKVENFNFRSGFEAQYASSHKSSRILVKPFRRYGRCSILKMAAVRHLGFVKLGNFSFRSASEAQYASSCKILWRLVEPFRRNGRFSIFQDGGRPPSWICFTRFGTTYEEYLVVFVSVQNLVVIGAVISIVCKF